MALSDEFNRLEELRQRGALTEEEFVRAKAKLLNDTAPGTPPALAAVNSFRRSQTQRWIGGVCGGIARTTGVEAWVWRLIFTVLLLFGGTGFLLYVLLWIFVPSE